MKSRVVMPIVVIVLALAIGLPYWAVTAESPNSARTMIQGRIISDFGPIEDVRIRQPGTEEYTKTDTKGRFTLPLEPSQRRNLRITAGKEGWFNNGRFSRSGGSISLQLNPLPRVDNPRYQFLAPQVCAQCHVELSKIYDQSKMAHTTSNPRVLQLYNGTDAYGRKGKGPGYKLDNPEKDGDCVTCHAPSIAEGTKKVTNLNVALKSKRLESDGISCDYCHKVKRITKNKSTPSGFKAHLLRQAPKTGNSILVMGPYDDVAVPPMAASYNSLYEKGQYCSQCHSHRTILDTNKNWDWKKVYSAEEWQSFGFGNDGALPIQTTYQEWKHWQASLDEKDPNKGKTCQDCHMSWRKDMLPFDNYVVNGHARMMWASYRNSQRIHPHQFHGGTQTQLKTAVSMEVEAEIEGNVLTATVFISNTNGGHWVPTGEPMRSVILVLETEGDNEKPLRLLKGEKLPAITGKGEKSKGNYAGTPGVVFAKVFEDAKGNRHVPFWQAVNIIADNRLRPKTTVSYQWQFRVSNQDDDPSVVAKLIYRPVDKELAASKKWLVEDIPITEAAW